MGETVNVDKCGDTCKRLDCMIFLARDPYTVGGIPSYSTRSKPTIRVSDSHR